MMDVLFCSMCCLRPGVLRVFQGGSTWNFLVEGSENRMGVKSQVILPSRQEDISSFRPKTRFFDAHV